MTMRKRPGYALHSSWNWELISDKPLDWWIGKLSRIKKQHPTKMLVASIMAGSGSDEELRHWQTLGTACEAEGVDALELNLSCPHMDRPDMGSNIGKDQELISVVTHAVREAVKIPVWAKLTPSTTDIVVEARGAFLGGAERHRLVEHVHLPSADRPRVAGLRDERRGVRLHGRPRRTRDPSALHGQDGADDGGPAGP